MSDDLLTFDNAQNHVMAFRPISEAARSWSDDSKGCRWLLMVRCHVWWQLCLSVILTFMCYIASRLLPTLDNAAVVLLVFHVQTLPGFFV